LRFFVELGALMVVASTMVPRVDLQSPLSQILPDQRKEPFPQLVGFQQVAKLADRRLIGHRFAAQINPDKLPHRARVVETLLYSRIRQVESLLQAMQAQHAFDAHGWAPRALGIWIHRRNRSGQVRPRHDSVHLIEEPLAAGGLAIPFKRRVCKRRLLHGWASSSVLRYP
jgi:hypothetical protein